MVIIIKPLVRNINDCYLVLFQKKKQSFFLQNTNHRKNVRKFINKNHIFKFRVTYFTLKARNKKYYSMFGKDFYPPKKMKQKKISLLFFNKKNINRKTKSCQQIQKLKKNCNYLSI